MWLQYAIFIGKRYDGKREAMVEPSYYSCLTSTTPARAAHPREVSWGLRRTHVKNDRSSSSRLPPLASYFLTLLLLEALLLLGLSKC